MKSFLFWILDRLILILFLVYVLMDTTLTAYEKCILLAVIGNMVVLKNIKDVIQDGFKNLDDSYDLKGNKVSNKYKSGSVRNSNEEL